MNDKAVGVSDKDVLVLDTSKHKFFWEQCCDCGLIHKTHISIKGKKVYIRHERRDEAPKDSEVCPADIISQSAMARILGRKGGKRKKQFSAEEIKRRKDRLTIARKKRWVAAEWAKEFPDPLIVCPNPCAHVDGYLCDPLECEECLESRKENNVIKGELI